MQEKGSVTREEVSLKEEDEIWDTMIKVVMFTVTAFIVLLPFIQQAAVMAQEAAMAAFLRVPTYTEPLEAVASNVGAMWYQMTPQSCSNELRMIAENSTGAFESMLLGLSS